MQKAGVTSISKVIGEIRIDSQPSNGTQQRSLCICISKGTPFAMYKCGNVGLAQSALSNRLHSQGESYGSPNDRFTHTVFKSATATVRFAACVDPAHVCDLFGAGKQRRLTCSGCWSGQETHGGRLVKLINISTGVEREQQTGADGV